MVLLYAYLNTKAFSFCDLSSFILLYHYLPSFFTYRNVPPFLFLLWFLSFFFLSILLRSSLIFFFVLIL